jgi:hypothetical protein
VSHCGSVKRNARSFVSHRARVRRSRLARERAERTRVTLYRSDVVLGQVRPVHALRVAPCRGLRAGRVVLPGHRVRDAGTRVRDARGVVLGGVRHVAMSRTSNLARVATRPRGRASVSDQSARRAAALTERRRRARDVLQG